MAGISSLGVSSTEQKRLTHNVQTFLSPWDDSVAHPLTESSWSKGRSTCLGPCKLPLMWGSRMTRRHGIVLPPAMHPLRSQTLRNRTTQCKNEATGEPHSPLQNHDKRGGFVQLGSFGDKLRGRGGGRCWGSGKSHRNVRGSHIVTV